VLLSPTLVQGDQAAPQIAEALEALNQRDEVEVVILTRGGGSLEELWPFNDEQVARAIRGSRAPVITGVGHETDFTIADFAADVRAPTPSAAAEMAVPDRAELLAAIAGCRDQMTRLVEDRLARQRQGLRTQAERLNRAAPLNRIRSARQAVDELLDRAQTGLAHRIELRRERMVGLEARLAGLSPQSTLERGYALVLHRATGRPVTQAAQVNRGDGLAVRVRDGEFGATVD
jgi:exodeoxyribonuclease VII large subunit